MWGGAAGWHFDHGWHGNDGHFWGLLLVAAVLVLRQQRSNQTRRIFVSAHNSCCALWMRLLWFVWVCWHNHLSKKRWNDMKWHEMTWNDMKRHEMICWPKPSPNMSCGIVGLQGFRQLTLANLWSKNCFVEAVRKMLSDPIFKGQIKLYVARNLA